MWSRHFLCATGGSAIQNEVSYSTLRKRLQGPPPRRKKAGRPTKNIARGGGRADICESSFMTSPSAGCPSHKRVRQSAVISHILSNVGRNEMGRTYRLPDSDDAGRYRAVVYADPQLELVKGLLVQSSQFFLKKKWKRKIKLRPDKNRTRKKLCTKNNGECLLNSGSWSVNRTSHIFTVTWLHFYCVVSFYTLQKSEWAGWRHCRNRVTWLGFYCIVSFYTIQKSKWAGWSHCGIQVTWLSRYERVYCINENLPEEQAQIAQVDPNGAIAAWWRGCSRS